MAIWYQCLIHCIEPIFYCQRNILDTTFAYCCLDCHPCHFRHRYLDVHHRVSYPIGCKSHQFRVQCRLEFAGRTIDVRLDDHVFGEAAIRKKVRQEHHQSSDFDIHHHQSDLDVHHQHQQHHAFGIVQIPFVTFMVCHPVLFLGHPAIHQLQEHQKVHLDIHHIPHHRHLLHHGPSSRIRLDRKIGDMGYESFL